MKNKNRNPREEKSMQAYEEEIHKLKKRVLELEDCSDDGKNDFAELFITNSRDMLYHMSLPEGEYKFVSPSALQLIGYTANEFTENPLLGQKIIHPSWQEYFIEQWNLLLQGECPAEYEYQIIHGKTGEVRWMNQRNTLLKNQDGKIIALEGFITDVTEYKENESKLIFSEERYRTLYDNSPVMFGSVSADTAELLFCNNTLLEKTGYENDELIGKPIFNLYHEDCMAEVKQTFNTFITEGIVKNKELILKRKDGSKLFVNLNVNSVKDEKGKILYSTSVWHDISEQKETDEKLVNTELRFHDMMQQSPNVIEIYDLDGLQISVNKAYEEMWGFPASTTLNIFNVLESEEVKKTDLYGYIKRAYAGEAVLVPEYKFDPTGDTEARGLGRARWLSTKIYPLMASDNQVTNIVITHEDITDRKEVQNKLSEFKHFYEEIIENVQDGIWVSDKNDNIFYVNKGMEKISGVNREMIQNKNILTDFPPNTIQEFNEYYLEAKSTLTPVWYEVTVKTPAGRYSWQNGWLIPKLKSGKYDGVICTIRDITKRRNAENDLITSETKLRSIVNNSLEGILVIQDGKRKFVNASLLNIIGYTEEEYDKIGFLALVHPEDNAFVKNRFHKVNKGEKLADNLEFRVLAKNGVAIWISATVSRFLWEGRAALLLFFTNITDKKRVTLDLQKSEEQFNLAMQATKDGLFDWDIITNEIYFSPGWKRMLGYEYDELPNDFSIWEELTNPADVEQTWIFINEIMNDNRSKFSIEFQMRHKDGHWVDIMARVDAIFEAGKAVRLVGTHVDISEIKKYRENLEALVKERTAELELKNSELKRFNQLFVGREFRIKELRDKVKKLQAKIGIGDELE